MAGDIPWLWVENRAAMKGDSNPSWVLHVPSLIPISRQAVVNMYRPEEALQPR
jgi:hypothetical protein